MINMNAYNKINASQRGIYIEGVIFKTNNVSLTEEEFADIFFPLIEAQGWMFGGAYMEEEDAED